MFDKAYVNRISVQSVFTEGVNGTNALLVSEHIPISLLELNTFGHAICALLIYVLWWEKPFEVDSPTGLQGQRIWDITALHIMEYAPSNAVISYQAKREACLTRDSRFNALAKVIL